MNVPLFFIFAHVQGDNWHIFSFGKKPLTLGFFSDTIRARSFKICMIMTLDGIYIVILDLVMLTLFKG